MPLSHLMLVLVIMGFWGTNFVVQYWAVHLVPPTLFATLRFAAVAFPLILLLPRPDVPWRLLIGYAATSFTIQFTLLFLALRWGMPPGLASLVMQSQVLFTVLLVVLLGAERPRRLQWAGIVLGAAGMLLVAQGLEDGATLVAFLMTLCAALFWSIGNLFTKEMGSVRAGELVVWGSALGAIGLLPISLWLDGPQAWGEALGMLMQGHPTLWACLLFNAYGASVIGYGGWAWLLSRHPATHVVPFTLLVPFFGMGSAAILLGEALPEGAWPGVALVLLGLLLIQLPRTVVARVFGKAH